MPLKHRFISNKPDGPDASLVRPSNWNEDHKVEPGIRGSILFVGENQSVNEDNANLCWDNVNKRLGIGTNAPSYHLHVAGNMLIDGDLFFREKRPFGVVGNILGRAVVCGSITANKGTYPENSVLEGLTLYWSIPNSDVAEPWPQITYDLGVICYLIREIRIYSDWASVYYPVDFKVEISSDGSTWTTIANVTGNNSWFWRITGNWGFRYLRITVMRANGSYDVHIKVVAYSELGGSYGSFVFHNFAVFSRANINEITFGYSYKDTNLYRGGADLLRTDDSFVVMNNMGLGTSSPEFKLDVRGHSCVNRIANADFTNTLRDSYNLVLRGAYWTGSASANRDAVIFHRMLSTTPSSEIAFQIAGVDLAMLRDAIADGETALLIRRNVGGTYSVVRVSMGPPDSGGTGYRVLRVPN